MPIINGFIFDADGTLLDSMSVWRNLGVKFLSSIGIQPEENLSQILFAMSFDQGIDYLRTHYGLNLSSDNIKNSILTIIADFYRNEVILKPNTINFLQHITAELHVPLTIATAGDRYLLQAALKRNGIDSYFDAIFTCSELNTSKHQDTIFLECANFMRTLPHNTLVFDDALFALTTAKNAGFFVAGVQDNSSINSRQQIINISDIYFENLDFDLLINFINS